MVDRPRDPSINELKKRLKRLELIFIAFFASQDFDADQDDLEELFYLSRRFNRGNDRDFNNLIERYMLRSLDRRRFLIDRFEEQVLELQHRYEATEQHLNSVEEKINVVSTRQIDNSKELHHYLMYQYLGENLNLVNLDRFIPVRVYLSDDNEGYIKRITNDLDELLKAFGFEFSDDFPAEQGSWWKKWFATSKQTMTQPEVTDRLEKVERALELEVLHKPQSEVTQAQAEAISKLTESIKDIPNAAIQAGSILLVKITKNGNPCLQVRTLSTKELIFLENNQHLLCHPDSVMQSLSNGA